MIVNPQFFNYRLIIGSLLIAFTVLAVFSFTNYDTAKSDQRFLEQEKEFIASELSQAIQSYDGVSSSNDHLSFKLKNAESAVQTALDSIRLLKSDLSVIGSFKRKFSFFSNENKQLYETVDSLNDINATLENDRLLADQELEIQRHANESLLRNNKLLKKKLEQGALLTANSFKAKAFQDNQGALQETKKAIKAEILEVCFTLAENTLTEKGEKELFVQIVNPKNNVIANEGVVEFGSSSLIYSTKTTVNYVNEVADVCTQIVSEASDKPFDKGTYYVSVFYKDRKLGSTQIVLN